MNMVRTGVFNTSNPCLFVGAITGTGRFMIKMAHMMKPGSSWLVKAGEAFAINPTHGNQPVMTGNGKSLVVREDETKFAVYSLK